MCRNSRLRRRPFGISERPVAQSPAHLPRKWSSQFPIRNAVWETRAALGDVSVSPRSPKIRLQSRKGLRMSPRRHVRAVSPGWPCRGRGSTRGRPAEGRARRHLGAAPPSLGTSSLSALGPHTHTRPASSVSGFSPPLTAFQKSVMPTCSGVSPALHSLALHPNCLQSLPQRAPPHPEKGSPDLKSSPSPLGQAFHAPDIHCRL